MSRLVYLSYPILMVPWWVENLKVDHVGFYRPTSSMKELLEDTAYTEAFTSATPLKTENRLLKAIGMRSGPPDRTLEQFADWIGKIDESSLASTVRDDENLLRSTLMISDISSPSFGEQGVDIVRAFALGIPILGITDQALNSLSLLRYMSAVIPASPNAEGLDKISSMVGLLLQKTPSLEERVAQIVDDK